MLVANFWINIMTTNEQKSPNLEQSSPEDDEIKSNSDDTQNPIAVAIDRALHRIRDIEVTANITIKATAKLQIDLLKTSRNALLRAEKRIDESVDGGDIDELIAAEIDESMLVVDRLRESDLTETLKISLFLGLFSAFDAYTGNLLKAIYRRKPDSLASINVEKRLSELLEFESFEELRESVLNEEIESFRRKSYIEQFEKLEKRFGLNLRDFPHWQKFVEISQRRNLFTHCDGIVSKQYLSVCRSNNVDIESSVTEGQKLKLSMPYLIDACSIMYEVAIKLGQTLWRKIFPEDHDDANDNLINYVYEALRFERWERAILLSNFAAFVQNDIQDLKRRVRIINLAIALLFSGKENECHEVLNNEDWTAAALDFKIAIEVLNRRFENASEVMKQIGKEGELITQKAYHVWPLFMEFRRSEYFIKAYQEVFDISYASELGEKASKTEKQVEAKEEDQERQSTENVEFTDKIPLNVVKDLIG
jgi:hypothetical protein